MPNWRSNDDGSERRNREMMMALNAEAENDGGFEFRNWDAALNVETVERWRLWTTN